MLLCFLGQHCRIRDMSSRTIRTADRYEGGFVAKTSMIVKAQREPKYSTRSQNRCQRCGRPHSVYRKFGLCRVCFRELASKGELPGVRKSSW